MTDDREWEIEQCRQFDELAKKIDMAKCFYEMAYPEKRCLNMGRWHDPTLMKPVDRFVWCDKHKHKADVLIESEVTP